MAPGRVEPCWGIPRPSLKTQASNHEFLIYLCWLSIFKRGERRRKKINRWKEAPHGAKFKLDNYHYHYFLRLFHSSKPLRLKTYFKYQPWRALVWNPIHTWILDTCRYTHSMLILTVSPQYGWGIFERVCTCCCWYWPIQAILLFFKLIYMFRFFCMRELKVLTFIGN